MSENYANALIHESSPYLQQHAHNPVSWLPWGVEALEKAKKENKPIFLSIGYSSCHWCHVMEKESFEDKDIGDILNDFYISIKVDREERPDVDHIYMTALQSMTEHAGWPLNMFLTPNAEPFYGGTYFPKEDSHGRVGFAKLLKVIAKTWNENASEILTQSKELTQHLKKEMHRNIPVETIEKDFLRKSVEALEKYRDEAHGGFYSAPKFPQAFYLNLYMELLREEDLSFARKSLEHSLRKMSEGGIYDHLAGGFHRYSTDEKWLVPHFEKMLYDNAILAKTYFEASFLSQGDEYQKIGKEICDYILKEMTHPEGAFYSSTDADTEGIEGRHFVWTKKDLKEALGEEDASLIASFYNIEKEDDSDFSHDKGTPPHSYFEGRVLHLKESFESALEKHKVSETKIESLKKKLLEYRQSKRELPFRDEKILSSWNALAAEAFCFAYEATEKNAYKEAAEKNLNFLYKNLFKNKKLYATYKDGKTQHKGTLEDYAYLISASLAFHRVSGASKFLIKAKELTDKGLELFWDEEESSFFYTEESTELFLRPKNLYDQALPSAHAIIAMNLYRVSRLYCESRYQDFLDRMLVKLSGTIAQMPHSTSTLIQSAWRNCKSGKDYVLLNASEDLHRKFLKVLDPIDTLLTERDQHLEHVRIKIGKEETQLFICEGSSCLETLRGESAILSLISSTS